MENLFEKLPDTVKIDKKHGYFYISNLLWYVDRKLSEEKRDELSGLIIQHLPKKDGEKLMRTIADSYIDNGVSKALKDRVNNLSIEQLRDCIIHGFSDAQFKAWHNYLKEKGFSPSGMNSEGNGSLHECLETFYDSLGNTQQAKDILSLLDKYVAGITAVSVNIKTLEYKET